MRAAAYTRYSSDNQRAESIDAQIWAIEEHCRRKGHTHVTIYCEYYGLITYLTEEGVLEKWPSSTK